jgi:F0F1-type ATP synthase assembly protein I
VSDPIKPSRRDRFRPVELLVLSLIVAVFIGVVVWGSTRDFGVGAIFGGIAFIVALVVLATLAITTIPDRAEIDDLAEQDADQSDKGTGPSGH